MGLRIIAVDLGSPFFPYRKLRLCSCSLILFNIW
jgi:hypothetical protein